MDVAASTVESRENMIINLIRRFNAAVIHFIMSIKLRAIGATLLGSMAGLSLTTTIIPTAMTTMVGMDTFSARWGLGGFAVYSMMAWAVGGWAAQRSGNKWLGAVIVGLVGLVTGLVFTGVGIGAELELLMAGGGAGLLYGAVGGLILADAMMSPYVDPNDPDAARGTIGEMAIFRYFNK